MNIPCRCLLAAVVALGWHLAAPPAARAQQDEKAKATAETLAKLAQRKVEIRLTDSTPAEAVSLITATARLRIGVDWRAMDKFVRPDAKLTLRLRELRLSSILREVFYVASGRDGLVDFAVQAGTVHVSTVEALDKRPHPVTYDCGKLLESTQAVEPALEHLIKMTVLPGTWAPKGAASAERKDDSLLVTQSARGHRELAVLLRQLGGPGRQVEPDGPMAAKLATNIPELRFTATFEQALERLATQQGINIVANWAALGKAGVARDAGLNLAEKNVTLGKALGLVLARAAGKAGPLDFAPRGEVVHVSTREDLDRVQTLGVYDVRRLIGAGGKAAAGLVKDLQAKAAPDSWPPKGPASVTEFAGRLIVRQSWRGHQQVAGYLKSLNEGKPRSGAGRSATPPP